MCTPNLKVFLRLISLSFLTLFAYSCKSPGNWLTPKDINQLLPYSLPSDDQAAPPEDALNAQVLLVGGKEAITLGLKLKTQFPKDSDLTFYSLTSPGFNLPRIFKLFADFKFKAKTIIFFPSIDDELETTFDLQDQQHILSNLSRINSWWWQAIYKTIPNLALSLLKTTHVQNLHMEPTISTTSLSDSEKINKSLTSSAIFKFTLSHWIKSQPQSNFIFISTPFDPQIPPSNCKLSLRWPTKNIFKEQMQLFNEQNWDKALQSNDELKQVAPFYATTYYLRAKILKATGKDENAFDQLNLSQMLNCRSPYLAWKNIILEYSKQAYPSQVAFYNFSKFVADQCFGDKKGCFNNGELGESWYQTSAEAIAILTKSLYKDL